MGLYGFIRGNPRVMRLQEIEAALRVAYRLEALPEQMQQHLATLAQREPEAPIRAETRPVSADSRS